MVRRMLNESLVVVKKLKWDPEHLDTLMKTYSEAVMNPNSDSIPDGLKIHFADIYLDEVEKVGGEQVRCFFLHLGGLAIGILSLFSVTGL